MVTTPSEAIAIASVSDAEPILPASAITRPAPEVMTAPETISSLKVALPAALPSMVRNVVSDPPSVPFRIISELFAAASIVMSPELVVMLTAASPAEISSAADEPEPIYVFNLASVDFLFVPPAPSSTMIKSASARSAPMSVPPSMSSAVIAREVTDGSSPTNLPSEELYLRNLPSTFAVDLCTSSKNSSLTSPLPGETICC